MAEGNGGDAAARSFLELTRSAGQVAQHVRARLAPSEAKSTWLGPSAELADVIAGSVLRCASSEAGSFWAVIPPRVPSVASVRRSRGAVTVRVGSVRLEPGWVSPLKGVLPPRVG
ncbi:hypothetical protein AB1Y20_011947 [Prymnesium parvum]|uniref:Uncharacterized protein n=1 Tax=Prymnesium parvum TaxID=97485 RepID=A0AB34IPJ9_PRYPA